MGFFDLNICYTEPGRSNGGGGGGGGGKKARVKLATKAMELGYVGIAYNHSIKGLMSEKDRCTIPLLTVGALVKLAPPLASSVGFHRELLGIPRATPFRQYTRLTVFVENNAQSQALNSGNPILKSYDIVAVRPLNQNAFDQACQRAEVDMISIDFSERTPFRLKHPMVKAAIQRGIYFEITYSDLLMDAQVRRQVISNAKLLVNWTRGKNLIISSGAPSVVELRGPNDVTNLMSLLGLSTERARAAISKNCRNMMSKALRKKRFYKETVRVELVSPNNEFYPGQPIPGDWLGFDPLSSGEGDMLLDDLAKAFGATDDTAPKSSKAIDFASILDDIPSHGFQVKDVILRDVTVSQPPSDNAIDVLGQSDQVSELPSTISNLSNGNLPESQPVTQVDGQISVDDKKVGTRAIIAQKEAAALKKCRFSWEVGSGCVDLGSQCLAKTHFSMVSKNTSPSNSDNVNPNAFVENLDASTVAVDLTAIDVDHNEGTAYDMSLRRHVEENDISGPGHNTSSDDPMLVSEHCGEINVDDSSAADDNYTEVTVTKSQKDEIGDNVIILPNLVEEAVISEQVPWLGSTNETDLREESSVPDLEALEKTIMEDKKDEETDTETNHQTSVQSPEGAIIMKTGKSQAKKRAKKMITVHQARLLPFKHFLHPSRFKRIHRRSKHGRTSL